MVWDFLFGKNVVGLAIARTFKLTKAHIFRSPFSDLQNFLRVKFRLTLKTVHDSETGVHI